MVPAKVRPLSAKERAGKTAAANSSGRKTTPGTPGTTMMKHHCTVCATFPIVHLTVLGQKKHEVCQQQQRQQQQTPSPTSQSQTASD